ncbi:MAG TPA: glycogen debranching N-terminal domain-containing protein [Candidatus Limnocylindrales bacterium]
MTERSTVRSDPAGIRFLPPGGEPIVKATDLGNVMVLKHENLYLLTDQFGDIHADSRGLGLYHDDTRILSASALRVNGLRPVVLQASAGQDFRDRIQLTNPDVLRDPGAKMEPLVALARQSLGIARERMLGGALEERVGIVNYTEHPEPVELELELAADDADIFEVRGYPRSGRGRQERVALAEGRVTFGYLGLDGWRRRTYVAFSEPGESGPAAEGRGRVVVRWQWLLAPGGRRSLDWRVWSSQEPTGEVVRRPRSFGVGVGGERISLEGAGEVPGDAAEAGEDARTDSDGAEPGMPYPGPDGGQVPTPAAHPETAETTSADADESAYFPIAPAVTPEAAGATYRAWLSGTARVETDNEIFDLTLERSISDLRLLMNAGPEAGERYVAAGVPWFATLFGRDAIVVALQLLAFRPQLAVETLAVLGARQATEVDDWRDAEPGKILHELRSGEMVRAGELPHTPYYGSVDATPLWLVLLGATYEWTGDRSLLERHWPTALRALEWIDRWGDRDGDGFVEYARRSERGLYNQGWKDSGDAVRDREGRRAELPVALVEVQGYVYDAKVRLARLARALDQSDLAARLDREAAELRERFELAYWIPDLDYYAMALDGQKRPADAIASNPGHCLWSGIVAPDRARKVATRLLAPDLFSGWGVRTYASGQRGYNPIGYHTGSVWPHDMSLIAAGLKRYGLQDEANTLIGSIFEAAQGFPAFRLPELFCGFERDGAASPVPYPVACSPQAWSAGAPFLFLQTMLGLEAHADRGELELQRPHLPEWLERVAVTDLRVGEAAVDLVFRRSGAMTSAEVLRKVGDLAVTIRL